MIKDTLQTRLDKLMPSTPAQFGIMTPQHMVEHLILTYKLSYGRIKIPEFEPTEKQLAQKQALIFSDLTFPRGIKAPGLPETLMELRYSNLEETKNELLKSVEAYYQTFDQQPNLKTMHPRFGKLSFEEWEKFHAKHVEHHLGQFGI